MHSIEQAHEHGRLVVNIAGELDAAAAQLVREKVLDSFVRMKVLIDLSRAQLIQDSALSILAELIRVVGTVRLTILGLGVQEQRTLQYMGVDPARVCVHRNEPPRHQIEADTPNHDSSDPTSCSTAPPQLPWLQEGDRT